MAALELEERGVENSRFGESSALRSYAHPAVRERSTRYIHPFRQL